MSHLTDIDTALVEQAFSTFKNELHEFLGSKFPNSYVYGEDIISVYTRKGVHRVEGRTQDCLDIANFSVFGRFRGNGLGMRVINYMHDINPYAITYVESLLNIGLYARLKDEGWSDVEGSCPPSVYKVKRKEY